MSEIPANRLRFVRDWNPNGYRTWIEEREGGTWAVENTHALLFHWRIVNTKTGEGKKIGPVYQPRSKQRINYFDRAMAECKSRNDKETTQ